MNKLKNAISVFILSTVLLTVLVAGISAGQEEPAIFKAMQDEMKRSLAELKIENLENPYFISYTVDDFQELKIKGSLGTLTQTDLNRSRYLTVDLRVGDYSLDNTNFVAGYYWESPRYFRIAIDDNYDAIRNEIYLATDKIYKDALKDLSRKKAYLQTRVLKNRPDDFLKLPANISIDQAEPFDLSGTYFEELVRSVSKVFKEYPEIISSQISLTGTVANQHYINSDGSQALRGKRLFVLELSISGKTPEGEDINDFDRVIVNNAGDLPDKNNLIKWAKEYADRLKALTTMETIEEYAGPVILTGDAAGEFFRQLFADNISNVPTPMFENEQMAERYSGPEFANKLKRRVLPSFFDVYDDPTIDKIGNLKLVGHFEVDDAGAMPRRVQLVDDGKLINLLIGIAPTKKIKEPNGHARGAVGNQVTARPGNLIFESNDKISLAKLKQSMLELCQDIDLEYGLLIKKLDIPGASSGGYSYWGAQAGKKGGLTAPLEIYKVYADGREEPVRNLEFADVTARILRDILQTGDQLYAYNYIINDDFEMPAAIVCPAVLVEEMELKKSEAKIKKPPILPSPLARK
jgi:TldD protein